MAANSHKQLDGEFTLADDDPLAELTRIIGLGSASRDETSEAEADTLEAGLADMLGSGNEPGRPEPADDPQPETFHSETASDHSQANVPHWDDSDRNSVAGDSVEEPAYSMTEEADQRHDFILAGDEDEAVAASPFEAAETADAELVADEDDLMVIEGLSLQETEDGSTADTNDATLDHDLNMLDFGAGAEFDDGLDIEIDAADLAMTEFDEESFFEEAADLRSGKAASSDVDLAAFADFSEDGFADAFDAALREGMAEFGAEAEAVGDEEAKLAGLVTAVGLDEADPSVEMVELSEMLAVADHPDHLDRPDAGTAGDAIDEGWPQPEFSDAPVATDIADGDVPDVTWDRDDAISAPPPRAADDAGGRVQQFASDRDVPDVETRVYDEMIVPPTEPLDIPDVSADETQETESLQDDVLADEFAHILRTEGMSAASRSYSNSPDHYRIEDVTEEPGDAGLAEGPAETEADAAAFDVSQLAPAVAFEAYDDNDNRSFAAMTPPPAKRGGSWSRYAIYGGGTALVLLLLAGGSYAYFSGDAGADGEVAVVRADDEPVKVRPAESDQASVAVAENEVYETVEGRASQAPRQDELVDTTEKPLEINGKNEARIAAEDTTEPQLRRDVVAIQPRKVRTFIVKPDGSIVPRGSETGSTAAGTTLAAASTAAGAAAAENAANPEAEALSPEIGAASMAKPISDAAVAPEPVEESGAEIALANTDSDPVTAALVETATEAAAADAADDAPVTAAIAEQLVDIPLPQSRPDVGRVTLETAAASPVNATPAPTAADAGPAAWVQIASQPSREAAQISYKTLSQRYSGILSGRGVNIVPAEIPGRGTFYRVNIAASSFGDAQTLCGEIKNAGGDCLARR